MYLQHFGLTHFPFERPPEPDELFASMASREAQARLAHLIELRGVGLIIGEVGLGKTTVCRQLAGTLHLSGLVREELADYLAHRLRLAGTTVALFEPPAQEAL